MDGVGIKAEDITIREAEIKQRESKNEMFELQHLKKKMINDHDLINSQYYRDLKQSDLQIVK